MEKRRAFQINEADNVATALEELPPHIQVRLLGDAKEPFISPAEPIPAGHKLALRRINTGEKIIKYGVVIGQAIQEIPKGAWVHLHCIRSLYDERSGHLDTVTGAPKDISYE